MVEKGMKFERRPDQFAERLASRVWREVPSPENPYLAERCLCHGYDLLQLMEKRDFVDVLYLLIRGELPDADQKGLLGQLMVGLCSPGPRHPATRAAMSAGVGKTEPAHILPISLSTLGGEHLGGAEVSAAMRFLRAQLRQDPKQVLAGLLPDQGPPPDGDWHIAPGFGSRYGGRDPLSGELAGRLAGLPGAGGCLAWGMRFAEALRGHGMGWLPTGVAGAALGDLGFHARAGAGLYQIMSAPGLLAHGLELANKPITAMPFVDDDHYHITDPLDR